MVFCFLDNMNSQLDAGRAFGLGFGCFCASRFAIAVSKLSIRDGKSNHQRN